MFVALEPRRLYRLVAEQIRLLIESGELTEGQRCGRTRPCGTLWRITRPRSGKRLSFLKWKATSISAWGLAFTLALLEDRPGKKRRCRMRMVRSKSCRRAASSRARLRRKPHGLLRRTVSPKLTILLKRMAGALDILRRRLISTGPSILPSPISSAIPRSIASPACFTTSAAFPLFSKSLPAILKVRTPGTSPCRNTG